MIFYKIIGACNKYEGDEKYTQYYYIEHLKGRDNLT
jgi:hypothetical protein